MEIYELITCLEKIYERSESMKNSGVLGCVIAFYVLLWFN